MRTIPNKEFWDNVRARYGPARYRTILSLFYGEVHGDTASAVQAKLAAQLPAMIDAMRVNGCFNEDAIRSYHRQLMDIWREVYGNEALLPAPQMRADLGEQFRELVDALGARYARDMRCHPTYNGYICYCDHTKLRSREALLTTSLVSEHAY